MLFTSEQVSHGHPDKICDQISDAIVTDCLRNDPESRVAVETLIKDNHITLAGEITSRHRPNYESLVGHQLAQHEPQIAGAFSLSQHISQQSPDIALGVDRCGAGDQGMMFGYACRETEEMLPLPFAMATRSLELLQEINHPILLPDAKAQVTYDYTRHRIHTFLISTQHRPDANPAFVKHLVYLVMQRVVEEYGQNTDFKVLVNPTGRFVTGGSYADTGVTGRKIMCDTYGGTARHGGGAFSGKDPTKVDRSAAYMARKIAKDILRYGLASRCEVQLAYAIGLEEPVSVAVEAFHTSKVPISYLLRWIRQRYDLTPRGIIDFLQLKEIEYTRTASLGHFWRQDLPWEQ